MPGKTNKNKVTLAAVYAKLVQHDGQFEKITSDMNRQFGRVANEIFRLENSLKAEIASVLDRVRQLERILDKQTADVELLRQEYVGLLQAVRRIEDTLETTREHDEKTDRALQEVLTRLERVEARLNALV